MMGKLTGKVALVTGASSGIGEATAISLAKEGAKVAIAAQRIDRLEAVAQKIRDNGGEVLVIVSDVSDEAQIQTVIQKTYKTWGTIDILVNNAGVMLLDTIAGANPEDWRRMFNVNVLGLLYGIHQTVPIMKANGGGYIVNLSSIAGRWVKAGMGVYSATKWSVNVLKEALRQEVYQDNIRVISIQPGAVDTELPHQITNAQVKNWAVDYYQSLQMLQSEDVANAVVYAVTQPPHVNVNEILLRPIAQES